MALPEYNEIIIAASYDHAVDWAASHAAGWYSCNLSPTGESFMPGFTTDEGKRIAFINDVEQIRKVRPETVIHFGPFPGGAPADIVQAAMHVASKINGLDAGIDPIRIIAGIDPTGIIIDTAGRN